MGRKLVNKLNDLTGSQWLYWTDTLYITNYPPDATHFYRKAHGAMKPPELMADIIKFFSKEGEKILDPFAGVGGTLLGASMVNRQALGIELNQKWVEVYQEICQRFTVKDGVIVPYQQNKHTKTLFPEMRLGDCMDLLPLLPEASIDAVITDPPYGCNHQLSGFKKETNFNMFNLSDPRDFGNAQDFSTYLEKMKLLGKEVLRVLKPKRYFIILIGDRYQQGEYIPLGYMVSQVMREVGFKFKGLKIWCNKATQRPLKPYGVMSCFVPNITHQNILILRKE